MTTVEVTIDADAEGRYVPGVRETPPSYSHGGLPPEPPMIEDLRITLRVPLRMVGPPDRDGYVRVDITALVPSMDLLAAEDQLVDEAEGV